MASQRRRHPRGGKKRGGGGGAVKEARRGPAWGRGGGVVDGFVVRIVVCESKEAPICAQSLPTTTPPTDQEREARGKRCARLEGQDTTNPPDARGRGMGAWRGRSSRGQNKERKAAEKGEKGRNLEGHKWESRWSEMQLSQCKLGSLIARTPSTPPPLLSPLPRTPSSPLPP